MREEAKGEKAETLSPSVKFEQEGGRVGLRPACRGKGEKNRMERNSLEIRNLVLNVFRILRDIFDTGK